MRRFVWFDLDNGRQIGRFVDDEEIAPARSDIAAPHFVSDTMDAVQSAVDGKFYTSKSALRATYQPSGNADGARYEEVGNDPARLKFKDKPKLDRSAIRDVVRRAAAGVTH